MKTIFISTPWFTPAFKAGGPIQSVTNMVNELKDGYQFYIFTSNNDLHGLPIEVTKTNEWVEFNEYTQVWYAAKKNRSQNLVDQVKAVRPDTIFIIGLFDWHFNIVPLLYAECLDKLLSVRGMLHPGALSQKSFKKKLFLKGLMWMKRHEKCRFHATDVPEEGFIKNVFGEEVRINIAANFPRLFDRKESGVKEAGTLRLVSIGIISPMKNYLLVLQALQQVKANVHYSIYGPVKEAEYWDECLGVIKKLPGNIVVEYFKEIPPHKVYNKLEDEHVFILPSKSENYGHAIAEALSAGLPVVTSYGVPWLGLAEAGAGRNVETGVEEIREAIEEFAGMGNEEYHQYSEGAVRYVRSRVDLGALREQYGRMFGEMRDER